MAAFYRVETGRMPVLHWLLPRYDSNRARAIQWRQTILSVGTRENEATIRRPMREKTTEADPLDREIDFSDARPNPYARDYYKSRNLRILAPDLLDIFPDSESVNEALRTLVRVNPPASGDDRLV
jgi:hypothetical protein